MSDEHASIHGFDLNLICEYFAGLERQGPGSPEATIKALGFIDHLTHGSRVADIGCGTGGQTMTMALNAPGQITGIDIFPTFIERFNQNAHEMGLQERVKGIVGSMDNLSFNKGELDLIWSEGAIYNIGFERGLKAWGQFLKKGGYIAVSEASWFTSERPAEIEEFWQEEYPGIDTIPNKLAQMELAGYIPVAAFVLPETCWTDHFYIPQVPVQEAFLKKFAGNRTAEEFIANQRHESRLYDRYREYYGYAFYIGRKR